MSKDAPSYLEKRAVPPATGAESPQPAQRIAVCWKLPLKHRRPGFGGKMLGPNPIRFAVPH
jgi:hypothetical protein